MKALILSLLVPFTVLASEMTLSDREISQKLVSVAKDIDNQNILKGISQLEPCKKSFQEEVKTKKAEELLPKLDDCLKRQLQNSGSNIDQISDGLGLETYQLIPSKSVKNVTSYLTNKLYQSMTGVNLDDQSLEARINSLKFKNKKQVSHKDFYDLYRNQIAKNAIYEVSRFCLIDFRLQGASDKSFLDHWGNLDALEPKDAIYNDSGSPLFSELGNTATDPDSSYSTIVGKIFGNSGKVPTPEKISNFFMFCGEKINQLCEKYEKSCNKTDPTTKDKCTEASGSKACITKTRLIGYRNGLKASEDIVKEFVNGNGTDVGIALNAAFKKYTGGRASGEKSINELTNAASIDFFKANQSDDGSDAQKCIDNGGNDCDNFIVESDSGKAIEANTQLAYSAKRAAEMEKVRQLVQKNDKSLMEYIETYYPDLKELAETDSSKLEDAVGQRWDARRTALIKEIKSKISSRQITEAEIAEKPSVRETRAQENAKDVLSEKARLAQVVFFNNIISGSLDLKTTDKTLGRNVQAIDNELSTVENEVQGDVFKNVKSLSSNGSGNNGGGNLDPSKTITNLEFLNKFIGVKD